MGVHRRCILAECWALWCYARAAKLGIPWIASQIYDSAKRRARPTPQALAYDEVGKQLACLAPGEAEASLANADDPHLDAQFSLHNKSHYNNRVCGQHNLMDALLTVCVEQQRGDHGKRITLYEWAAYGACERYDTGGA